MKKASFKFPAYLLVIMNALGFLLLFMANNYQANVLYVGIGLLGLFILIYSILVICNMGDKYLVLIASMLMTLGVLMLCRLDIVMGARQIVWISIGGIVFFVTYCIYYNIRFWNRLWLLYAGNCERVKELDKAWTAILSAFGNYKNYVYILSCLPLFG